MAPLFSGIEMAIGSLTGEPPESISGRRGLELLLLLTAKEVNFPLSQEVEARLLSSIFGRAIADALELGATIGACENRLVLVHPSDETVH